MRPALNMGHQESSVANLPESIAPAQEMPGNHQNNHKYTQTDKCFIVSESEYRWLDLCTQRTFVVDLSKNKNVPNNAEAINNNATENISVAVIEGNVDREFMFEDISNSSIEINNNEVDVIDVNALSNNNEGEGNASRNETETVAIDDDTRENVQSVRAIITIDSDDEDVEFVKITRDIKRNPNYESLVCNSNYIKRLLLQFQPNTTISNKLEGSLNENLDVYKDTDNPDNPESGSLGSEDRSATSKNTATSENRQENVIETFDKETQVTRETIENQPTTVCTVAQTQTSATNPNDTYVSNMYKNSVVHKPYTSEAMTSTNPYHVHATIASMEKATHKASIIDQSCSPILSTPEVQISPATIIIPESATQTNETIQSPKNNALAIIAIPQQPPARQTDINLNPPPVTTSYHNPQITIPTPLQSHRTIPCTVQCTFSFSSPFESGDAGTVNLPVSVLQDTTEEVPNKQHNSLQTQAISPYDIQAYQSAPSSQCSTILRNREQCIPYYQSVIPSSRPQPFVHKNMTQQYKPHPNYDPIHHRQQSILGFQQYQHHPLDVLPNRQQRSQIDKSTMHQQLYAISSPQQYSNNMTSPLLQQHHATTTQNTQQYLSNMHQQELLTKRQQQHGVLSSQKEHLQTMQQQQFVATVPQQQTKQVPRIPTDQLQQKMDIIKERLLKSKNNEKEAGSHHKVRYPISNANLETQHILPQIPQQYYDKYKTPIRAHCPYPYWKSTSKTGALPQFEMYNTQSEGLRHVENSSKKKEPTGNTAASQMTAHPSHFWPYSSKKHYYLNSNKKHDH